MLSQAVRSAKASAARRATQRTLSTSVGQSSSPGPLPIIGVQHDRPASWRFEKDENRTRLWIRPWDGITSLPEGLAVVRAIERKYGKLRYYLFLRDEACPDMYQPYCFAEFDNVADIEQIPIERHTIQLEIPKFKRPPSGGIGLEHIDGLLTVEEKVDDYDPTPNIVERVAEQVSGEEKVADTSSATTRVIDVQLERSLRKANFTSGPAFRLSEARQLQVSKSVVQWGGFYAPPAPSQPLTEEDILLGAKPAPSDPMPEPPRKHMEQYLRTWRPKVHHLLAKSIPLAEKESTVVSAQSRMVEDDAPVSIAVEQLLKEDPHEEGPLEAEVVEVEPTPEPVAEPPRPSKRRERLLALARQNARTPLPESVRILTPEEQAQKRAEFEKKKEEEKRMKETVRDRLWKLMGGGGGSWL